LGKARIPFLWFLTKPPSRLIPASAVSNPQKKMCASTQARSSSAQALTA
jgi:hypothetical protein